MLIALRPLIKYRDFRFLFMGQGISFLGSQITMVALPFQIYQLTHSSFLVGLLALVQLIPLFFTAILGGVLADRFDRRRLLIASETILVLGSLSLLLNSLPSKPSLMLIFGMAALMSGFNGLHRPSIQSLLQIIVPVSELSSISSLWSFMCSFGMVVGPAVAGLIISQYGLFWTFAADSLSFGVSLLFIAAMSFREVREIKVEKTFTSAKEGILFALSRQELLGSYVIDIVAMLFGMPSALFPAIAHQLGGAHILGLLYSAVSIGALLISLTSGWTNQIVSYGKAITISALFWGLFIILLGYVHHFIPAMICLACAGAADALSGIFRQSLWNKSVPNELRGRLASIEMLSYMSGPMLGNLEAGLVASLFGVPFSIISGGAMCIISVVIVAWRLPQFWRYKNPL
jgi:MFS family permease